MVIDELLILEHASLAQKCLHACITIDELKDENKQLNLKVQALVDLLNSRRSERTPMVLPEGCTQNRLFGTEVESEGVVPTEPIVADPPISADEKSSETQSKTKNTRGKNGRTPLPATMETVKSVVKLDPSIPRCAPDGTPFLVEMCSEERVDSIPRRLVRLIIERETLVDPKSNREIVRAMGDNQIVEQGILTNNTIIELALQKYEYGMPMTRQIEELSTPDFALAPSTIVDNISAAANLAEPIVEAMKQEILTSHLVFMDETPVRQLTKAGRKPAVGEKTDDPETQSDDDPDDESETESKETSSSERLKPAAIRRSQVFAMHDQRQVVFQYSQTRSQREVLRLLGFDVDDPQFTTEGLIFGGAIKAVMCDGYVGYDIIDTLKIGRAGCWSHARRKFFPLVENGNQHAAEILLLINKLFKIESETAKKLFKECRTEEETLAGILTIRQKESKKIVEKLKTVFDAYSKAGSPKNPLRLAAQYCVNNWTRLERFLSDPKIPLDNNSTERGIRPIAVGRKAYLFMGSAQGGKNAAIFYSLIESCAMQKIDSRLYLRELLHALGEPDPRKRTPPQDLTPLAMAPRIKELMPNSPP
jgi:transposase